MLFRRAPGSDYLKRRAPWLLAPYIREGQGGEKKRMDLNYLFHRQQVERTRAAAAASNEARAAHEQLARCYETQINRATDGRFYATEGMPARGDYIDKSRSKKER